MCGVDSVPSDVGSFVAAQRLKAEHGEATTVTHIEAVMTKFSGGAPAGTVETVAGVFDGTDVLQKAPLGSEKKESARLGNTTMVGLNALIDRSSAFNVWCIPFFMAGANSNTVRRSNALLGYAPNLKYTERWGFPDFSAAFGTLMGFLLSGKHLIPRILNCFAAVTHCTELAFS